MNSEPIFRRSTFRNEDVLISESLKHLPLIRIIMIIICIIIGIGTLINLILIYNKYKLILKHNIFHRIIIPLILFLNIIFHVSHYVHNIYDPAIYFEPKKLYLKIFFSEMEKTFLFNFPLSILFLISTWKLLLSCTNEQIQSFHMLIIVTLYSLMSMISGGHYLYEPPTNFSFLCNITIAGETIIAFLLFIMAIFVYQSNSNKSIDFTYTRLTQNDKSELNIPMSVNQQRQIKSKLSDNESM
ncbi:unnamed protein product [Rotaria sordida]|uniref:Uncharacterized protein n=1 Tax=Rotaria sordida TaxID=392033 RepID=A0A819N5D2_9BILA|nr:unnamed protein product [Rotaria sordida]